MEDIILFFIKSIIASAILFGFYLLFLKNRNLNIFNRFYLLMLFPLSLAVPLIHFSVFKWEIPSELAASFSASITNTNQAAFSIPVLASLYFLTAFLLLFLVFYKSYKVLQIKKTSVRYEINGFCLIETDDERAPFSFFNNLFWRKGIDAESEEGKKIMRHETIHMRQHHSYDRLFCHIMSSLFWINPFFWKAQKELSVIHEFLADEQSFDAGDTFHFAKMILSTYSHGSYLSPDLGFNKSDIGRRVAMISSKEKKYSVYKKASLMLALICIMGLMSFGNSYVNQNSNSAEQLKKINEHEQKLRDERKAIKLGL